MKEFHECVKGEHFDEVYAMCQVNDMYHTKANGVVCRGQIFTVEDAGSGKVWNYFKDI